MTYVIISAFHGLFKIKSLIPVAIRPFSALPNASKEFFSKICSQLGC